jgi:hypothetical protein
MPTLCVRHGSTDRDPARPRRWGGAPRGGDRAPSFDRALQLRGECRAQLKRSPRRRLHHHGEFGTARGAGRPPRTGLRGAAPAQACVRQRQPHRCNGRGTFNCYRRSRRDLRHPSTPRDDDPEAHPLHELSTWCLGIAQSQSRFETFAQRARALPQMSVGVGPKVA